jgi:hypothetical protein
VGEHGAGQPGGVGEEPPCPCQVNVPTARSAVWRGAGWGGLLYVISTTWAAGDA